MKLKITMELEIGDLTDEQRAELEDDINFVSREKFGTEGWPSDEEEEGYTPTVPTLAEQNPEEIMCTLTDALHALEDWQEEIWAGTDIYARITNISHVDVRESDDADSGNRLAEAERIIRLFADRYDEIMQITGAKYAVATAIEMEHLKAAKDFMVEA